MICRGLLPSTTSGKIAAAWRTSLVVHLLALAALAQPWQSWDLPSDQLALSGQRGAVYIQASFVEPEPSLPVVEIPLTEASVVVTPQQAKVLDRTFKLTSTAEPASDAELPEVALSADGALSVAASRGSRRTEANDALPRALEQASKQISRTTISLPPLVAGLEQGPDFAGNPPPEFPELARQNGWYGTVLLKLWIDEGGRVTDVRVEKSSGYGVLDAAAVNAVKRWRGRPARHHARPVATEEFLPVVFRPRLARDGR
jgi:protein TonB